MIPDQLWPTDETFGRSRRIFPMTRGGTARVDYRRVISGIVHVL